MSTRSTKKKGTKKTAASKKTSKKSTTKKSATAAAKKRKIASTASAAAAKKKKAAAAVALLAATRATASARAKSEGGRPSYPDMISEAIMNLAERGGSSRQAIFKYIVENYGKGLPLDRAKAQISLYVKRGCLSMPPLFEQVKQSFKMARGQKVKVKARMSENKRSGAVKAISKVRESKPLGQWTIEALRARSMKHEKLVSSILAKCKVAEARKPAMERSIKAAITKGVNKGIFERDARDTMTFVGEEEEVSEVEEVEEEEEEEVSEVEEAPKKPRGRPRKSKPAESEEEEESNGDEAEGSEEDGSSD